jgi:NAD-dependent deacetylase
MTTPDPAAEAAFAALVDGVAHARRVLVFTGAGVSTESGIPDFRGPDGLWKKVDPAIFTIGNYLADRSVRVRSWRNRLDGAIRHATPNDSHRAIVELQWRDVAPVVVTQNIDGLHQRAGSTDVIEVHGTIRDVVCMDCGDLNPADATFVRIEAGEDDPPCLRCGGILKVATISFGQELDPVVLDRAFAEAESADVCLACGSTLSVTPAALIPLRTVETGGRLVIVNAEPTELDAVATTVVRGRTGEVLPALVDALRRRS